MSNRKLSAFTIAELLIATALTVIIVALLGGMFGSLMSTASHANQRTDTFRDARAALQMMARDFSNIMKIQPAAYFVIDGDAAGNDVRQLDGLVSLKNTPLNSSSVAGDVCAVRYYCGWNGNSYSLRRYFRDSDLTFKTFQLYLSGSPPTLSYVLGGCQVDNSKGASNTLYLGSNPTDEILASYAWNLQVVAYDSSGNVINPVNDAFGHQTTGPYMCDPNGTTNALPASIEMSFDALSPEAARALVATPSSPSVWMVVGNPNPSASDKALYDHLILPHMYHFRTRIDLQ